MDLGTAALKEHVGEESLCRTREGLIRTAKGPGEWAFTEDEEVASFKKEASPGSKAAAGPVS